MQGNFIRQFHCFSPLYAGLYVSFSVPPDFLHFLKSFLRKYSQNISSNTEMNVRISNIIRQSQTELGVMYFRKNQLPS